MVTKRILHWLTILFSLVTKWVIGDEQDWWQNGVYPSQWDIYHFFPFELCIMVPLIIQTLAKAGVQELNMHHCEAQLVLE